MNKSKIDNISKAAIKKIPIKVNFKNLSEREDFSNMKTSSSSSVNQQININI